MSTNTPTPQEACQILDRFNNSHWDNSGEQARYSIPPRPDHDDDLRMAAFIDRFEAMETELQTAQAEILGLRSALEKLAQFNPMRMMSVEQIDSLAASSLPVRGRAREMQIIQQALTTPPPPVVPVERLKEAIGAVLSLNIHPRTGIIAGMQTAESVAVIFMGAPDEAHLEAMKYCDKARQGGMRFDAILTVTESETPKSIEVVLAAHEARKEGSK